MAPYTTFDSSSDKLFRFFIIAAILVSALIVISLPTVGDLLLERIYRGDLFPNLLSGRTHFTFAFYHNKLRRAALGFDFNLLLCASIFLLLRLGFQFIGGAATIWSLASTLVLLELFLAILIKNPSMARIGGLGVLRGSLKAFHPIQYQPDCSRYDQTVSYTLKPGSCVFDIGEAANRFMINSSGLRDDEISLTKPDVIVLGDSFAMGWGVEQNESFSQILEVKTGLRVLNAGISSYGTAREMLLLNRLDTSQMKFLIIQYSPLGQGGSDFEENQAFLEGHGHLTTLDEAKYTSLLVSSNKSAYSGHVAGQFIVRALYKIGPSFLPHYFRDREWPQHILDKRPREEVEVFLYALEHGTVKDLSAVTLIVFEATGESPFIENLKTYLNAANMKAFYKSIGLLDLRGKMSLSDYYVYDPHWTPQGHKKIADLILPLLK